jgi:hypothetical protein
MKRQRSFWLAAALGFLATGAQADAVIDWNANAGAAASAACMTPAPDGNPLQESRLYAMVHLAVHDAVNAIDPHARAYAFAGPAPGGASAEAAVAAAAHDVLVSQIPRSGVPMQCADAGVARADVDFTKALADLPQGAAKEQGIAVGRAAAAAVIAKRANDGSDTALVDPNYPQGTDVGQWRFTPGSPPVAFAPGWGKVKPFGLKDAAQFRPRPPLTPSCDGRGAVSCRRYAKDLEEIRRLGGDGVSTPSARTADQTEIALFWLESSPFAWNRIARTVSTANHLDLYQNARLFALLNAAQADGYIASWATKFHYGFWRPITAIREAANDGNPGTTADANWMSLMPTPPVPDYESAHAIQGAIAAEVIRKSLGAHAVTAFSQCSNTLPARRCNDANPARRRFESIDQAAIENGESRILIGYHFRDAVEQGLTEGRHIADWTVRNLLELQHPY